MFLKTAKRRQATCVSISRFPGLRKCNAVPNRHTAVDTTETSAIVAAAEKVHNRGLKKKDSLHLASAIALECEVFFTTDDGLLKKRKTISEIKILNPIEYYADYND